MRGMNNMIKTAGNFKLSKLQNLNNQIFEITEEANQLNFYIEGIDNNKNTYSLEFTSFILKEQMLKFEMNQHIDFIKYVDDGDIVFSHNNLYDLNTEIRMDIMRYLSNNFLLNISFKDRDDLVGNIELDFKL